MTTGALIFAFNNEKIDYVAMAAWSADNIHRHLDIPVCLVTDSEISDVRFDKIIKVARSETTQQREFADIDGKITWYNHDRVDAYAMSPWDQTLVLDADYVVASQQLRSVLLAPSDFVCYRNAWDVSTGTPLDHLNHFGHYKMPMWWATVMLFRRSPGVENIFDSMKMVRDNWNHYRDLFAIGRSRYRNDFALSISLNIISGHTLNIDSIPYNLATIMPDHRIQKISTDHYRIDFVKDDKNKFVTFQDMDFHAMGKGHLGDIIAAQG